MKTVIIVEDEKMIRESLAIVISKNDNFSVVGSCKNGREALTVIRQCEPDIVITDIKMPLMDGLQLIKECKKLELNSEYIILSGYKEFDYLKEAHYLGVIDYLLKPIDYEELILKLSNLSKRMDIKKNESNLIKEQFGMLIIKGLDNDFKTINQLYRKIGFIISDSQVITINIYRTDKSISLAEIKNYIDSCAKKYIDNIITFINKKQIIILIEYSLNQEYKNNKNFLVNILMDAEKKFKIKLIAGMGSVENNINKLNRSFELSKNALTNSIFNQSKHILAYDIKDYIYSEEITSMFTKDIKHISNLIFEQDCIKIEQKIHQLFDKFNQQKISGYKVFIFCDELYKELYKIINLYEHDFINILKKENLEDELMCTKLNYNDVEEIIKTTINKVINLLSSKHKTYGFIIDDIIKYIKMNYNKDLKIKDICEKYYINKSYFCKIFKDRTGLTFNNYLTDYRISKAKQLLKFNYKIYEISNMIGLKDTKYFIRLFKKKTGYSPNKFRNTKLHI